MFGGRYRTRTATTTTAASGRNREELLGPRSDFSRPRQGVAEKSANATRKAISARCAVPRPVGMSTKKAPPAGASSPPAQVRVIITVKGRVSSWRWHPAFCFAQSSLLCANLVNPLYGGIGGNRCVRAYRESVYARTQGNS